MKKHLNQLTSSLNEIFNWHKSRVDCFANLLISLISRQTVNLAHLAAHFARNTKIESNYRRIQSFFKEVEFDYDRVAHWSIEQMLSNKDKFYLAIDRTNWQFGKTDINILMLSAVYEGIAIPLYWEMVEIEGIFFYKFAVQKNQIRLPVYLYKMLRYKAHFSGNTK